MMCEVLCEGLAKNGRANRGCQGARIKPLSSSSTLANWAWAQAGEGGWKARWGRPHNQERTMWL